MEKYNYTNTVLDNITVKVNEKNINILKNFIKNKREIVELEKYILILIKEITEKLKGKISLHKNINKKDLYKYFEFILKEEDIINEKKINEKFRKILLNSNNKISIKLLKEEIIYIIKTIFSNKNFKDKYSFNTNEKRIFIFNESFYEQANMKEHVQNIIIKGKIIKKYIEELKNIFKSEIFVLTGIPGSGKSTYANNLLNLDKYKGYKKYYISLDAIRTELFNLKKYNEYYKDHIDIIEEKETKIINEYIKRLDKIKEEILNGIQLPYLIIIDNTNINSKERKTILEKFPFVRVHNIIINILPNISIERQNNEDRKNIGKVLEEKIIFRKMGNLKKNYDYKDFDEYDITKDILSEDKLEKEYIENIVSKILNLIELKKEKKDIDLEKDLLNHIFEYSYLKKDIFFDKKHISPYHQETLTEHLYNVVYETIKGTNDNNLIIASIFHDLGKIYSCKKIFKKGEGFYIFQGHEFISYYIYQHFCPYFKNVENKFKINSTLIGKIIKYHGIFNSIENKDDIEKIIDKYRLTIQEVKNIYKFEEFDKKGANPTKEAETKMNRKQKILKQFLEKGI